MPRRNNPLRNVAADTRRFSNDNPTKTTFHFFAYFVVRIEYISQREELIGLRIIIALLNDEKISDDAEIRIFLVSLFSDIEKKIYIYIRIYRGMKNS